MHLPEERHFQRVGSLPLCRAGALIHRTNATGGGGCKGRPEQVPGECGWSRWQQACCPSSTMGCCDPKKGHRAVEALLPSYCTCLHKHFFKKTRKGGNSTPPVPQFLNFALVLFALPATVAAETRSVPPARGSLVETEREREKQREKQAPCGEPDAGLDSVTPGSRPGLKAAAQPPSHPGVPRELTF